MIPREPRPLHEWASFDSASDVVTIYDMRYSRELLRNIAVSQPGYTFKIVERGDGVVTISSERNALEAAAADMYSAIVGALIAITRDENSEAAVNLLIAARAKAEGAP